VQEKEKEEAIAEIVEQPNPWADYPHIRLGSPEAILAAEVIGRKLQAMRDVVGDFEDWRLLSDQQRMLEGTMRDIGYGSEILQRFAEDRRTIERAMRDISRGSEALQHLDDGRRMIEKAIQDSAKVVEEFQASAEIIKEAMRAAGLATSVAAVQPQATNESKKSDEPPKPKE
jgi:hypothetical protein